MWPSTRPRDPTSAPHSSGSRATSPPRRSQSLSFQVRRRQPCPGCLRSLVRRCESVVRGPRRDLLSRLRGLADRAGGQLLRVSHRCRDRRGADPRRDDPRSPMRDPRLTATDCGSAAPPRNRLILFHRPAEAQTAHRNDSWRRDFAARSGRGGLPQRSVDAPCDQVLREIIDYDRKHRQRLRAQDERGQDQPRTVVVHA